MNPTSRPPHEASPPKSMEFLGPWWRFGSESLKDGGDSPMRPLWQAGLSAQRIYGETLNQQLQLALDTQTRIGHCLQDLAASRRPQDWMAAQTALMMTAFEATASQAQALQQMAEGMRSCCQQIAAAPAAAASEGKPAPAHKEAQRA